MCVDLSVICPGCGRLVYRNLQECFYEGVISKHKIYKETQAIQSSDISWWSCPKKGCELNMTLHWALNALQANALLQDQAYSSILPYLPLMVSDEGDEACELALSQGEVAGKWCPPPNYFSAEQRLMALKMLQKGGTVREIAKIVDKGYHTVGKYINVYIRPNLVLYVDESGRAPWPTANAPSPVAVDTPSPEKENTPSPEQVEAEEERDDVRAEEEEEEESPLPRVLRGPPAPVPGAPDPEWLSSEERRLVHAMRQRGESKRAIAEALDKPYARVVKYTNAYIIPREIAPPKKRKRSDESQADSHYEPRRYSKRPRQQDVESQSGSEPRRQSKRLRQQDVESQSGSEPRRYSKRLHQQKTGTKI